MDSNTADEKTGMGQAEPPRYQDYHKDPSLQYGGASPGAGQYPLKSVQPTVITVGPLDTPLNDYLGFSIFNMLCCCLPLGVAALVYSISTRDANFLGNQVAAERSSNMARKLNHAALGIGIIMLIISIALCAVVLSAHSQ